MLNVKQEFEHHYSRQISDDVLIQWLELQIARLFVDREGIVVKYVLRFTAFGKQCQEVKEWLL